VGQRLEPCILPRNLLASPSPARGCTEFCGRELFARADQCSLRNFACRRGCADCAMISPTRWPNRRKSTGAMSPLSSKRVATIRFRSLIALSSLSRLSVTGTPMGSPSIMSATSPTNRCRSAQVPTSVAKTAMGEGPRDSASNPRPGKLRARAARGRRGRGPLRQIGELEGKYPVCHNGLARH
jgi:hypothetical protein